MFYANDSVMLC